MLGTVNCCAAAIGIIGNELSHNGYLETFSTGRCNCPLPTALPTRASHPLPGAAYIAYIHLTDSHNPFSKIDELS